MTEVKSSNRNKFNQFSFVIKELVITCVTFAFFWIRGVVLYFVPQKYLFKDVKGQNILITGAGSGLGQGLSVRFARLGVNVVGVDLNLEGLKKTEELVKKENGKFYCYECDISKSENVYKMADKIQREVGFISILVNNAGIVSGKKFLSVNEKDIIRTFEVNTYANFWTCKAFLPAMREKNFGHIVTISSLAGLTGAVQLVDYCASKFAAVGFLEALRFELSSEGFDNIKSTCVCPFFINTGMFNGTKSRIIPILEQDYAVDQITKAILCDQKILIMPRLFYFMNFFRSMLPLEACDYLYEKIGGHTMMSNFVGRTKDVK